MKKYYKKMSDQQRAFFASPGDVTVKAIVPKKAEIKTELVKTDGMLGVLDPLPNADWPLRKDTTIHE